MMWYGSRSYAQRGNARPDAPRPVPREDATQSLAHLRSHAERGNENALITDPQARRPVDRVAQQAIECFLFEIIGMS